MNYIRQIPVIFFTELPGHEVVTEQPTGIDAFDDISRGDAAYTLVTVDDVHDMLSEYMNSGLTNDQASKVNNLMTIVRQVPDTTYVALEG